MDSEENILCSSDLSASPPEVFHIGGNRHAARSKAGCWTCREKKVKCDEVRPACYRCVRLDRECDYAPRQKKKSRSRRPKPKDLDSPTPTATDSGSLANPNPSANRCDDQVASNRTLITKTKFHTLSYLPPPEISAACSLVLSADDHELIQHFRTSFAERQHTKNPKYSVLSIIFRLAESSPMVMHMVTAIAGQEINYLQSSWEDGPVENSSSAEHYGNAIRLLADTFRHDEASSRTDPILATLWLMMQYEQRFGDGQGMGLKSHLSGLAAVLTNEFPSLAGLNEVTEEVPLDSTDATSFLSRQKGARQLAPLSTFATRMLIWFSNFDASAATCGVGGQVNNSLSRLLSQVADDDEGNPIKGYFRLHQHSNSLFPTVWGDDYPQDELLDDLENRQVFYLLGECGQLRYMVANLAKQIYNDEAGAEDQIPVVERAIHLVGRKYADILRVATSLKSENGQDKRLVTNIRYIVPNFHAIVLQFLRVARSDQRLDERQRTSLHEIMTLAFRSFKQEGDTAMIRISWPLFMAGLETDDLLHREWILDRLRSLGRFGLNYKRAFLLLEAIMKQQEISGDRVNMLDLLESGCYESFVV